MARFLLLLLLVIVLLFALRALADGLRYRRLRRAFSRTQPWLGLSPEQIREQLGAWQFWGSLENGDEVATWQCRQLWVEVWFREGRAVAIVDRSASRPPRTK